MNNLRIDQTTTAQRLDHERDLRAARSFVANNLRWELRLRELEGEPVPEREACAEERRSPAA
jgi:hypothetical protein